MVLVTASTHARCCRACRTASSVSAVSPLWETAMQGALDGMPVKRFVAPPAKMIQGPASASSGQQNQNQNQNQNRPTPNQPR